MKDFKYELSRLPDLPGVYLMKDIDDNIIYVGKAKNLKNRVRSYFSGDSGKSMKVIRMVEKIDHFEYIIVENEVEALVLESNFIKEHRPHYNILLRDDKQYPYIMVTNEKFPKIEKVRQVKNDGNFYYGPYPNVYAVNDTIDLLEKMYKIRDCNLNFDKGQRLDRPCLNYFIGRCDGPCIGKADEDLYMGNIEKIKTFLSGKAHVITGQLEKDMRRYSEELRFERAAECRDNIRAIEQLMERQKVTNVSDKDLDIISMYKERTYVTIQIFFMRSGKIVDREHFILENNFDEDDKDIIDSFMKQFYLDISFVPKEILLPILPSDASSIEELLSGKASRRVELKVPKRGSKLELITMATTNAKKMMLEFLRKMDEREKNKNLGLIKLEETLSIRPIKRIEAYDISNIAGVDSVASMIVYEDGKKSKKEYRKFKIRTVSGPDDYASMEEVLRRRFNRYEGEKNKGAGFGKLPSLIMMDGGKGHVHVAQKVLKEFNLPIKVIGLVKDDKHKTKGIILNDREIILDRDSAIYRFLYEIQEEVHRFAISYHNNLRSKNLFESELNKIEGLGKKRIESLLKHFKSTKSIGEASLEQLQACPSINKSIAENIYNYFRRDHDQEG